MQEIEGSSRRKNSAKKGGISTAKIEKAIVQSMYMYTRYSTPCRIYKILNACTSPVPSGTVRTRA